MNATRACLFSLSLIGLVVPSQSQATAASGSQPSAPSGTHETGKSALPETANSNGTTRGTPPAGKRRLIPIPPPDRSQALEERLRSGQMEKPIAQGEISERLDQLSSGSK